MDGIPRTLSSVVKHLRGDENPDRADRGRVYWLTLVPMVVGSLVVVSLVPDPVTLITILAAVTFLLSPIYFVLNSYCVTRFIEDPAMRPSTLDRVIAKVGVVFIVGCAILLFYTEIFSRLRG